MRKFAPWPSFSSLACFWHLLDGATSCRHDLGFFSPLVRCFCLARNTADNGSEWVFWVAGTYLASQSKVLYLSSSYSGSRKRKQTRLRNWVLAIASNSNRSSLFPSGSNKSKAPLAAWLWMINLNSLSWAKLKPKWLQFMRRKISFPSVSLLPWFA